MRWISNMEYLKLIYLMIYVFGTLLVFWIVMNIMVDRKKIIFYLPFYFIGFSLFLGLLFTYIEDLPIYLLGYLKIFLAINLTITIIFLERVKK
jgi:hypothetical protein